MAFRVIGIDPGVTRAGVVVMDEEKAVLAAATFSSTGKYASMENGCRVMDLADEIADWAQQYIPGGYAVRLAIETPVFGRNVEGFGLQWRTIQAIIDRVDWDTCIEVHNTRAKLVATKHGGAKKPAMVAASPWSYGEFAEADVEALADAWAIGLVAFKRVAKGTYHESHERACHDGPVKEV